jgi:hypothetical protein
MCGPQVQPSHRREASIPLEDVDDAVGVAAHEVGRCRTERDQAAVVADFRRIAVAVADHRADDGDDLHEGARFVVDAVGVGVAVAPHDLFPAERVAGEDVRVGHINQEPAIAAEGGSRAVTVADEAGRRGAHEHGRCGGRQVLGVDLTRRSESGGALLEGHVPAVGADRRVPHEAHLDDRELTGDPVPPVDRRHALRRAEVGCLGLEHDEAAVLADRVP